MVYLYNMTTTQEEPKAQLCKYCYVSYEATKENFYTCKGKLRLDICKECKKERSRQNEKNRKPRDRREYNKSRYLKKKLEKQKALEASKNSNDN